MLLLLTILLHIMLLLLTILLHSMLLPTYNLTIHARYMTDYLSRYYTPITLLLLSTYQITTSYYYLHIMLLGHITIYISYYYTCDDHLHIMLLQHITTGISRYYTCLPRYYIPIMLPPALLITTYSIPRRVIYSIVCVIISIVCVIISIVRGILCDVSCIYESCLVYMSHVSYI